MIRHRVAKNNEPLGKVADEYSVSHETIRRIMLHGQQAAWTARNLAVRLLFLKQMCDNVLLARELADAYGPYLYINLSLPLH